jgi:hypothetical protein
MEVKLFEEYYFTTLQINALLLRSLIFKTVLKVLIKFRNLVFILMGIILDAGLHTYFHRIGECYQSRYYSVVEVHISDTFFLRVLDINPIFQES